MNIFVKTSIIAVLLLAGCSRTKQHPDWTRSTTSTIADAYYLRAYRNGKFIFVHKGHIITTKCRHTLSWLNGNNTEGQPMTEDGKCTYVTPEEIGKYYGDDLMLNYGDELHFCPWLGVKTSQTADILDIESDELEK
jgi:hypothetical protein